MGIVALVALLAQPALVMLAYQVTDTRSLVWGNVVSVGTGSAARTVAALEILTQGARHFGGESQGGVVLLEIAIEGEFGSREMLRMEDPVDDGRCLCFGGCHAVLVGGAKKQELLLLAGDLPQSRAKEMGPTDTAVLW